MVNICASCGKVNPQDARFCLNCGSPIAISNLKPDLAQSATVESISTDDTTIEKVQEIRKTASTKRNWFFIGSVMGAILIIGGLYFWLFVMDDLSSSAEIDGENPSEAGATLVAKQMYAMTEANVRDRATTVDSQILGKMPRGSAVTGVVKLGVDGASEWLELSDGKGFIAVVNLSEIEPPEIAKALNDKVWTADGALDVWAQPDVSASLVDRVSVGTKLTLAGLTTNGFIEVKLGNGGYGYLADGASILARLGGKPVSISFNPQSCGFGGELDSEFAKIGARLRAQWAALENAEYADEEARERAYSAAEDKSSFVRLQRSFEGLSITAIAQHYEAQSVYFADPPAKVIEVFRAKGFRIGSDGTFASTELYAGISGTRGEGAAYGKSELGCGV